MSIIAPQLRSLANQKYFGPKRVQYRCPTKHASYVPPLCPYLVSYLKQFVAQVLVN